MEADEVLKKIGEKGALEYATKSLEPLARKALTRIMRFKPTT
jgi:hypothetical protein